MSIPAFATLAQKAVNAPAFTIGNANPEASLTNVTAIQADPAGRTINFDQWYRSTVGDSSIGSESDDDYDWYTSRGDLCAELRADNASFQQSSLCKKHSLGGRSARGFALEDGSSLDIALPSEDESTTEGSAATSASSEAGDVADARRNRPASRITRAKRSHQVSQPVATRRA